MVSQQTKRNICATVLFFSVLFLVIGLASPEWSVYSTSLPVVGTLKTTISPWKFCGSINGDNSCQDICKNDNSDPQQGCGPINTVRAFGILAVVAAGAAALFLLLGRSNPNLGKLGLLFAIACGVCGIIAMSTWTNKYTDSNFKVGYSLGLFILGWIFAFLFVVAAVFSGGSPMASDYQAF